MLHTPGKFSKKSYIAAALLAVSFTITACTDTATAPVRIADVVVVAPASRVLVAGEQLQYTARALDASGKELTGRNVAWTSADVSLATVTEAGLVTALRPGATSIRATVDGKVGVGTLQITTVPVASIAVDVAQLTLSEGLSRTVVATVKDAQGNVLADRPVTWESANTNIASVSATGIVTALVVGNTVIRAMVEGKTAEVVVAVSPAAVAVVEPAVTTVTIEEGEIRVLTAVTKDALGRVLAGRGLAWTSDDAAVATIDANGRLTAVATGQTNVRVNAEGRSAAVAVTVTLPRVASVSISPAAVALEIGESRQLQTVAKDARGNTLNGRIATWTVVGGNATVSPGGMLTGKRNGPATVVVSIDGVNSSVDAMVLLGAPYAWDLLYHRSTLGAQEIFTQVLGTAATPVRLNAGTVSRAPTASPNGLRIAFAVSMIDLLTGNSLDDIYAVDRNGLNMKQLTNTAGHEDSPAWSPDGSRIAYVHWNFEQRMDVWLMNADGSNAVNLTADMTSGGALSTPVWSPDGSRIAFVQTISGLPGTMARIWTMRADGTNKQAITSTTTGFDSGPTWSADGTRIAFMRYFAGDADIATVSAQGGAVTRFAMPGLQANPSWSPDGTYIAFQQNDGPLTNIYTMRPDGSALRLRTVDPTWGGGLRPTWIRSN